MAVKIGHASIDENGRAIRGAAGDQTGKEVCTRNWYNGNWTKVFRAKDSTVAEKIAKAMEQACANNYIGYDQGGRTTLYYAALAAGWDLSKINKKVETDCSALVAVCINAAGVTISKDMYTGNQEACIKGTGEFSVLTDSYYRNGSDYLKRGDILLKSGHTVIVLSDGAKVTKPATTQSSTAKKSAYEVAKEVVNGKWGTGAARKAALTKAGYNYNEIQDIVNSFFKGGNTKSVTEIAKEVIAGKWGVGADRKKRLTAAGYDYKAVQKKVNELL